MQHTDDSFYGYTHAHTHAQASISAFCGPNMPRMLRVVLFFFAFCVFLCARFRTHRSTHPFAKKQPTNQRAQSVFLALFLTSPPLFLTFLPLWKPREGPKRLLRL